MLFDDDFDSIASQSVVENDEHEDDDGVCERALSVTTASFERVERVPEAQRRESIFWALGEHVKRDPRLRFWCAPMVGGSELAFRLFVRQHGVGITTTPMIIAGCDACSCLSLCVFALTPRKAGFHRSEQYRQQFTMDDSDRPFVVQFAADRADDLLAAAKLVEERCDGVEINLGCPMACASDGHFGAFLMTEPALVYDMVPCARAPVENFFQWVDDARAFVV